MRRLSALLATPAGRVARYMVSGALILWLVLQVDWSRLRAVRGEFSWPTILAALVLVGVTFPLQAWRWWLLLRAQNLPVSLHWAHAVTWIGQFYNAFLLGGLGGDAARVYYVVRDLPGRRAAGIATLLLDRIIGLIVLMAIAAAALAARPSALDASNQLRGLFLTAATVAFGGIFAAAALLRFDPNRWPVPIRRALGPDRLAGIAQLLAAMRAAPGAHVAAIAVSTAIWLLDFVATWLAARAVGLPLPFLETCVAMSVAYAVTFLPISVGGHGVREGAMLATLAAFGLLVAESAHERAILLALIVWATTVFWSLVGGVVVLAAPRLLPAVKTPAP